MAKRTITWTSIIKLNTGCRLHTKLKKGQFTLVTLWCGRNSSTQCIFLVVRSFIDPTFCGIFFCCPLQFKCQIFFPILLPHNVTLPSNAFYGGNVACISVGLFFFFFFFLLQFTFTSVAARISHFLTAAIKKTPLCCFVVVIFSLITLLAMRFTAEMGACLKCKISPTWRVELRTYVWTILSELKFIGCIDNQIFLPTVLRYKCFVC